MRISRSWKHWLAATGGITVAAFAVSSWLGGFRLQALGPGLFASFVFTVCIGTLASLAGHLLWPRAERWNPTAKWMVRILSMLCAVAFGTLGALSLLWSIGFLTGRGFWRTYFYNLQFATFITASFGLALMIYEYWRSKYEHSELERERATKLVAEARLASLESRLHPHFLFNTLNSISSLIHSNPGKADDQLQRLCALLRFSLDSSETRLVPLEREMKIVRDYLEIEQTRFGDRLRFRLDLDPGLAQALVPPLSIQTLVENSVKHVIAPSRMGGEIVVTASSSQGVLTISVRDDGPGVAQGALSPGHGLDNLRARLQVLFADRARLAFDPAAVRMEVPL